MNIRSVLTASVLGLGLFAAGDAHALITGVTGQGYFEADPTGLSMYDSGAAGTDSPSHFDGTQYVQTGFDEQQGAQVMGTMVSDSGTDWDRQWVDSHYIFLNTPSGTATATATWTFDGQVLGVFSSQNGENIVQGHASLGAAGVYYGPAFGANGLEANTVDGYTISGNTLTVTMSVSEPGDWIRVITRSSVLELDGGASAASAFALLLGGLMIGSRRRRSA